MQLNRITDPRGFLERATRKELELFAKARGVMEIECGMPAPLMREILRRRGVTDIENHFPYLRGRQLGQANGVNQSKWAGQASGHQPSGREVSAVDDLMRQWNEQKKAAAAVPETYYGVVSPEEPGDQFAGLKMHELRTECKKRNIAFTRSDKADTLRARLNGKDTS